MATHKQSFSRRDFFNRFLSAARSERNPMLAASAGMRVVGPKVAIVQGRYCLAYQSSFCSVCYEQCPEPGAIVTQRGAPRVVADFCTGCGICRDVCPAPVNAILMAPASKTKPAANE